MASPRNLTDAPAAIAGINVEAWTQDLPLSTANLSAALAAQPVPFFRENRVKLDIPLDNEIERSEKRALREAKERIKAGQGRHVSDDTQLSSGHAHQNTSEPRRRDSLKRREALLKGKEGSRRRQKWENDHLLGNPAFQPPEPQDWAPHPTHRVQNVPYRLAPLWDEHYAHAARQRADKARQASEAKPTSGQVPKELREKLKRAKGAKSLLQNLEEQVRSFVGEWEEKQRLRAQGWDVDVEDSDTEDAGSEEEVIFVGRNRRVERKQRMREHEEEYVRRDKLIFDSLVDDHGASFGRWLVHSIASYYNLRTWSVTTGKPARREAYVGIPDPVHTHKRNGSSGSDSGHLAQLPRPLWVMI